MSTSAPNANPIFGGPYLDQHSPDPSVHLSMPSRVAQVSPVNATTVSANDAPASTNQDGSSAANLLTQYNLNLAGSPIRV